MFLPLRIQGLRRKPSTESGPQRQMPLLTNDLSICNKSNHLNITVHSRYRVTSDLCANAKRAPACLFLSTTTSKPTVVPEREQIKHICSQYLEIILIQHAVLFIIPVSGGFYLALSN